MIEPQTEELQGARGRLVEAAELAGQEQGTAQEQGSGETQRKVEQQSESNRRDVGEELNDWLLC